MTIREVSTLACWVAILASFVLSFSTWLALGTLAGFGVLAVAMPFCVDGYIVTSLTTWLTPGVSERLARFARANLYSVGLVGVAAQAGYHGWLAFPEGATGWPGRSVLATAVGALPMAIATLAVHIRARAAREGTPVQQPELQTAPATALATAPASATLQRQAPPAAMPAPPVTQPVPGSQPVRVAPATAGQTTTPAQTPTVPGLTPAPAAIPVPPTTQPQPVRVAPAVSAARPAAPAAAPGPRPKTPPRHKVEQSGSGPRRSVTVDDVRPLIRAGLGRNAIAQQLGIGTGVARRLIDEANAESGRLVAVP